MKPKNNLVRLRVAEALADHFLDVRGIVFQSIQNFLLLLQLRLLFGETLTARRLELLELVEFRARREKKDAGGQPQAEEKDDVETGDDAVKIHESRAQINGVAAKRVKDISNPAWFGRVQEIGVRFATATSGSRETCIRVFTALRKSRSTSPPTPSFFT